MLHYPSRNILQSREIPSEARLLPPIPLNQDSNDLSTAAVHDVMAQFVTGVDHIDLFIRRARSFLHMNEYFRGWSIFCFCSQRERTLQERSVHILYIWLQEKIVAF